MEETTIEEILDAQSGNQEILNHVVEKNSRLVWSIVKRFNNRKIETEDLFQIGAIGLVKSIKRFKPEYNVKISTFAATYIIGEIKRFLRDDGSVKISRTIKELNYKIENLKREYEKIGKNITIQKLQEELKETKENIILALESNDSIKSLDEVTQDKKQKICNQLKVEGHEDETIKKIILKDELKKLSQKEKQIIIDRFFYDKTQTEIAKKMNISQVQVSRIEKKILIKMRKNIKEKL